MDKSSTVEKSVRANVTFKEAFKGYNKDDVNSYLAEINLKFSTLEENYRRTIATQKLTIEELEFKLQTYDISEAELNRVKQTLAEKEELYKESVKKIAELEEMADEQSDRLAKLREECAELEKKLSAAIAENAGLSAANQMLRDRIDESEKLVREQAAQIDAMRAKNERLAEESSKSGSEQINEELSRKVGEVLIMAKESADKILDTAKAEADQIKSQAEIEAQKVREQAEEEIKIMRQQARFRLEESLEQANKKLTAMSEEYISGYTEYLRLVSGEFDEMIEKMRSKSREIKDKVESLRDVIGEELSCEYSRIADEMNRETGEIGGPDIDTDYGADTSDEKI